MQANIDSSVLEYLKSLALLCVEDNKTTQILYGSIFEDMVKKIIFADNGEDGYQKFYDEDIDLIIADYDMPVLNGIDMIKKIRGVDKDIPIILVSAIEDIDVIVQALQLNVNNFIKKPIVAMEVMQAIENVSKLLIANNYIKEQREKRIREFEKKEKYNSYQEDLAFSKELNIVRNDFYYHMIDNHCMTLIDFYYKPLDVLSGDAYSIRKINNDVAFYSIVDGMGKGLSASLTSMLMTSFINHTIDQMIKNENFELKSLTEMSLEYIRPILLDEEALSIDFITINCREHVINYAKFAMPSILMQTREGQIVKIKSNNPPMSKYTKELNLSTYAIKNISKFLFYSDGVIENSTIAGDKQYAEFIESDFLNSFSKEEMVNNFLHRTYMQEDDITFIIINQLDIKESSMVVEKKFQSTLDEAQEANDWYSNIWSGLSSNYKLTYNAGVVFSELFMNAFEHGNLGLDADTKHKLLNDNGYFAKLEELQKNCIKNIEVKLYKMEHGANNYIVTIIKDEGEGFDTKILNDIFKKSTSFNGRGVYISKKSSLGVYYNGVGNSVLFLHKI